jgi:phospholipase/lecithinase/hemolysin
MTKKLLVFLCVALLAPAVAAALPLTTIVVLGDSLSDQGNGFLLTGGTFPPAPYAQRASNGPVAVERLAQRLGVVLLPAAGGGTNYAVLGATTGPVVIPGTDPPVVTDNYAAVQYGQPALAGTGIVNQALSFVTTGPAVDPASTLFVVWGGPNDFFLDPSPGGAANAVGNLAGTIALLYDAGARQFLVPNMADLSLTPFGQAAPPLVQAGLQALSIGFNAGLGSALDGLDLLPGIDITRFDTFALLTDIANNPAAYGFANATDACLTGDLSVGGIVCADPNSSLFWDSVHPTARGHQVLGNHFAAAVPEPALVGLLGMALVAGAISRRRARQTPR